MTLGQRNFTPATPLPFPMMLCAFEGWNDAGSAASQALNHLADGWQAHVVRELDPERYHDFQVNRPQVSIGADGRRHLAWPATTIAVTTTPGGAQLVIVRGIEPSMRWRSYCAEILDMAESLGVRSVVCLGALLADVPHSRPIPISASSCDPFMQDSLGIAGSQYEGPTGIVGVLEDAAADAELHAMSMWAAVPHYVAHPPSPKATLALLGGVEDLVGENIDTGDLIEDARAWQRGVDELAAEDPEIAEYVQQLEEAKDTAELPEASGDAIAEEFERYLRRRERGNGG